MNTADDFPPALSHGPLAEIFPDVFFVTGGMDAELGGDEWHFSRNMTVLREDGQLALVNAVRLDDDGLAALEGLGEVAHVVRIGSLHDRDVAFYQQRYGAALWELPGMPPAPGSPGPDHMLAAGEPLPVSGANLFEFRTTRLPESILFLDRNGGVAIASDALQNWLQPDEHFSDATRERMESMGFFTRANVGPVWIQMAEPQADDFARLKAWHFRHALCGHGEPLRESAGEDFAATFRHLFDV